MAEQQDQDRSEEPTPFKLKRAREKGQVARGMDLGFVGSLLAFAGFMLAAGPAFVVRLADLMRLSLTVGIDRTDRPATVLGTVRAIYWLAFQPLLVLGGIVVVVLVFLELMQLRGFIFTTAPLKPDFSRLNPAKGLKRLFSLRMVKETLKNVVKMAAYALVAWFMITGAVAMFGDSVHDAASLARAMDGAGKRLLFAFLGLAFLFMVLDQVIVRGEFMKQMRMSRRELTRETKEREGEPRLKQKRRELHGAMRQQAEGLGKLDGSDFLVTNPEHFAVALAYDPESMDAPTIRAKGRNHFAQLLKRKARLLGIPIIADPALARGLFHDCKADRPIAPQHFHAVARHYARLRRAGIRPSESVTPHG
ncbi:MAG: EscU/YscU/HrcU family type III secretion system export apparatus switch protein [Novosphingobium sp.]|nr:EscU/YscU/HrcU family type III secretion system export apparatus switch protein [Novosphingobium sp.]